MLFSLFFSFETGKTNESRNAQTKTSFKTSIKNLFKNDQKQYDQQTDQDNNQKFSVDDSPQIDSNGEDQQQARQLVPSDEQQPSNRDICDFCLYEGEGNFL